MHWQEYWTLNQQVPMPPSQQPPKLKSTRRPQQAPRSNRSSKKLYHPHHPSRRLWIPARPAEAPEQMIDPSDQGMPLIVVFQEFTADESIKDLPLTPALINFVAEDIPSASPADQGVLQAAPSSQRQKIALKQVS